MLLRQIRADRTEDFFDLEDSILCRIFENRKISYIVWRSHYSPSDVDAARRAISRHGLANDVYVVCDTTEDTDGTAKFIDEVLHPIIENPRLGVGIGIIGESDRVFCGITRTHWKTVSREIPPGAKRIEKLVLSKNLPAIEPCRVDCLVRGVITSREDIEFLEANAHLIGSLQMGLLFQADANDTMKRIGGILPQIKQVRRALAKKDRLARWKFVVEARKRAAECESFARLGRPLALQQALVHGRFVLGADKLQNLANVTCCLKCKRLLEHFYS